ncbi:MAG TPA: DNA-processing protein DprA [Pirellulales bacterium]|jgi:DNA processing protein|nr:DNA-processing protein DprA [Pirellulales bacterium]
MNEASAATDPLEEPGRLAALRLSMVSGVGPRIRQVLLEHFASAEEVLAAAPSQLREVPGVGAKLSAAIVRAGEEIDVAAEIALCRSHDVTLLACGDADYPPSLAEIPDPPGVLYLRGQLLPRDALAVAIVGSRHATQYGLAQAERLASSLARAGLTIVSGLARGIDAAAHRGALAAGGRTLAVLGSGLLNIYPPEHDRLAAEVVAGGALVSENSLRSEPFSGSFPQRNRLISGLSLGVIVVEASTRSGALITARHASEQGREVFAVPGRVDSRMSHGCHQLLRDGARLVETADDVLEELGPLVSRVALPSGEVVHHPAELALNELERQVLAAIGGATTSIDHVVTASGLPTPQVLSTLSVLEMRRLIRRISGNYVARI